jgi:carbamoylphosphate synthase small subunit
METPHTLNRLQTPKIKITISYYSFAVDHKSENRKLTKQHGIYFFSCHQGKRVQNDSMQAIRSSNLDLSSDNTLFQLLSQSTKSQSNIEHLQTSFTSVLSQLSRNDDEVIA